MQDLTNTQKAVLDYIVEFRRVNQFSPTTREIADAFGCCQNASTNHVKALERKGWITTKHGSARTIVPVQR
jgi:repressor LexA